MPIDQLYYVRAEVVEIGRMAPDSWKPFIIRFDVSHRRTRKGRTYMGVSQASKDRLVRLMTKLKKARNFQKNAGTPHVRVYEGFYEAKEKWEGRTWIHY